MSPKDEPCTRRDITPSLIARLRAGDPQVGILLEELYRTPLTRFCSGYVGSRGDAEDLVQDVFCRVLASPAFPDNFRAWIYTIARNRCLDALRARGRKRDDQELPGDSLLPADRTGNLTRLVRKEQRSRLHDLMATLPPAQREVLCLRYVEGLSRGEIAEVLNTPESLVKSRIFEGLEKLRDHTSLLDRP